MTEGDVQGSLCADEGLSPSRGLARFLATWRAELLRPGFRWDLLATAALDFAVLHHAVAFFNRVETRPGVVLADPLLASFAARDVTWVSFVVVVGFTALGIGRMLAVPRRLLVALQAYAVLVALRALCMYLAPFEAPVGLIVLEDPFGKAFGLGAAAPLTKDLFFSGHTSILALAAWSVPKGAVKKVLAVSVALVAACVLVQHVHYAIDVVVAPFMAFGALRLVEWVREQLGLPTT